MGVYFFCLCLGFLGLIAIAVLGHGHAFLHHSHLAHAATRAHARGAHPAHAVSTRNYFAFLQSWLSPRVFFSLVFAFGAAGTLLGNFLPALVVIFLALVAAWAFERWLVQPIWHLIFGFASNPARMLDNLVLEEAEAVMNFDRRGQGLVAVNLDGALVQILATLSRQEQQRGVRIRAGERVSITAVDPRRNRCTVTRVPIAAAEPTAATT